MAISGKFLADFSSFYDAVNKAEVELRSFETGAHKVEQSLNRMADAFSGRKVIQDATLMVQAIEQIGGVSKLTERELARVSATAGEAAAKMRAMGMEVPPGLQKIADATRAIEQPAKDATSHMVALGSAIGTFVGNFAFNLLQRGISSVVQLGLDAFATAGKIDDMSKKLGISAEAVQGFSFAAEQSGTTIDAFGTAITRMNINLAEGNKSTVGALKAAGLEIGKLRTMRPEEAFLAITDALALIPDPMERVRIGTELMGKTFAEILPAIQDGLRETADSASKMSDATVARLAAAEDAWAALRTKITIVTGEMIGKMIENLNTLEREWGQAGRFERIIRFGPLATLLNLAEHFGLVGKASKTAARDIELFAPVVAKTAADSAEAQRQAAAATAAAHKKAEDAARAMREEVERQRKAVESLGLVTNVTLVTALEHFADMEANAVAEGVELDAFLVAIFPKLNALMKAAQLSGIEVGALADAFTRAGAALQRSLILNFDQAGLAQMPQHFGEMTEALERMNTVMSPEQWQADQAARAMAQLGITSRDALEKLADDARRAWETIVRYYGVGSREATEAFAKMIAAQMALSRQLPNYLNRVIIPSMRDAVDQLGGAFSQNLAEMLVDLQDWKVEWDRVWDSIKQAFANILADMLNDFVQSFLQGMIDALAKRQLGQAFGNWVGGLFGGGGAAAAATIPASVSAPPAAAAAGPGAGGGGGFAAIAPFAAIPVGAALLSWGISNKGWFQGGMEGVLVNPARDRIFQQFVNRYGGQFSPFESMVKGLAEAGIVGEPARQMIANLYAARTKDEYFAAYKPFAAPLQYLASNPPGTTALAPSDISSDLRMADVAREDHWTVNIGPGAIVVNGDGRTAHEVAQELAPELVDVILRENPNGVRTRLRHGLLA